MTAQQQVITKWQEDPKITGVAKTPLNVAGILIQMLKQYFGSYVEGYKWAPDPVESQIKIDLVEQWKPEDPENFPAVYVKRENWLFRAEGRVMGDYRELINENIPYSYRFWVPVTTQYSIIVKSLKYGECEELINFIACYFTVFAEPIRRYIGFQKFDTLQVTPTITINEPKQHREARLGINTVFSFDWQLMLEKPLIKNAYTNINPS